MTTPKPIDSLAPEELRVECAISQGWRWWKFTRADGTFFCILLRLNSISFIQNRGGVEVPEPSGDRPDSSDAPPVDTDANAALQLAHALAEPENDGWIATIENPNDSWCVWFRGGYATHFAEATGHHAFALALCRAYLSVIRAGKEQQG